MEERPICAHQGVITFVSKLSVPPDFLQTPDSVALPLYNALPDFGLTIGTDGSAVSFDSIGVRPSTVASVAPEPSSDEEEDAKAEVKTAQGSTKRKVYCSQFNVSDDSDYAFAVLAIRLLLSCEPGRLPK